MKIILFLVLLTVSSVAFADVNITVTLTDEEFKAMSVMNESPDDWIKRVAKNKAKNMIDDLVSEHSDKQPDKATKQERDQIINSIDIEKEKNARHGK